MFQTNVEEIKKNVLKLSFSFRKSCLYEIMCETYCRVGQATDGNIIRRMRFVCWIPKATNKHSEYAILIVFLLQPWLHERTSVLRLYENCLSCCTSDVSFVLHIIPFISSPDDRSS